ncbi:MAG: apolipoprotein N-acyltransferase [Planctomycetota bacterium]|jgi:apolipoprotein N-acyltransferase
MRRFGYLALAYAIYVLAGPGMLIPEGSPLGALALIPWALSASRPGPYKKRIEWLCGGIAFTSQVAWMGIVFWFSILWLFIGFGCWAVWGGWLMKHLARVLPLTIATPLAWVGFESFLAWTPPPIGLSWLRLGHYLCDWPVLAGSGRVWGVVGLGFLLATIAGFGAELYLSKTAREPVKVARGSWIALASVLAFALLSSFIVRPPGSKPGPRLLLIQPNIAQARLMQRTLTREDLFMESLDLTREGLEELAARGERAPDLVCWSETILPYPVAGENLKAESAALEIAPWLSFPDGTARERLQAIGLLERNEAGTLRSIYGGDLGFGRSIPFVLDKDTAFFSGVQTFISREGRMRRTNSAILWGSDGKRLGSASKRHLAPGGETMVGLERWQWVRDIIWEVAGYVPDLAPALELETLALPGVDGQSWNFGATVCFDNGFTDVYAEPLRKGPLDFHLIVSNEAWYLASQEFDQMVAFTRMMALCTARSASRCSNSGISAGFGMQGEELARIVVDGRDREVRGTLVVDVPVPEAGAAAPRTPFIWLEPWLKPFAALLPLLLIVFFRRKSRLPGLKG